MIATIATGIAVGITLILGLAYAWVVRESYRDSPRGQQEREREREEEEEDEEEEETVHTMGEPNK